MIEEITKFNSFDPKALYSALEYLSRLLKEDSETLEVYIKNHSDEYESSITLGRKGWVAPFYLDNYFLILIVML